MKSFYSDVTKDAYTFYRQGYCFTMAAEGPKSTKLEKISSSELGPMYLLFDQALVTQSSGSIIFFKIDPETGMFTEYTRLTGMRGQIYFIKGNKRIQVTTDERIYFYLIDPETLEPTLENVMFNYMNCSQMMFGAKVRFCVTFKQNQQDFSIWCRKYYHNFKVTITEQDLEGSCGANIPSSDQCVIAHGANVVVYDIHTHKILYSFSVPTKDEPDKEILYMTVSLDELRIGICIGRKLIRDH